MAEKLRRLETKFLDLSPDMLILIIAKVNHLDRLSLSLVSKPFRSLTNQFVHELHFRILPSNSQFRKLFARFSSVNRISISSTRIARALMAVAKSGLKIDSLTIWGWPTFPNEKHLASLAGRLGLVKGLRFEWFPYVNDFKVAEFLHLFESLEYLDLSRGGSFNWTDAGIEMLAHKCKNLRKVNLDFLENLTARSLDAFAECVNLEHITFCCCVRISFQDVWNFVQKAKNLKSLELPEHLFKNKTVLYYQLAETKPVCENLTHLSIMEGYVTDAALLIIAGMRCPLTSLELKVGEGKYFRYTMVGLSAVLHAFQGLAKLYVHLPRPGSNAQDMEMSHLVKGMQNLKEVHLVSWSSVCATLFSLIDNCPLLESIRIHCMKTDTHWGMPQQIKTNYSVQRLCIVPWPDTLFETILKSYCPSLNKYGGSVLT